jgi:hypothetical protein
VAVEDNQLVTGGYGAYIISTQSSSATPEADGNVDSIVPQP